MKNKEQFDKSVETLVNAYRNGELRSGISCGCAVGQLIRDSNKSSDAYQTNNWWFTVCEFRNDTRFLAGSMQDMSASGAEDIKATGYTVSDISQIEVAFEFRKHPLAETGNAPLYDRLAAVYDVLCDIHEVDAVTKVEPSTLFTIA